jgi:RecA-family ATPase
MDAWSSSPVLSFDAEDDLAIFNTGSITCPPAVPIRCGLKRSRPELSRSTSPATWAAAGRSGPRRHPRDDLAAHLIRGYEHEGLVQINFDPWISFSVGERFVNDGEASLILAGAEISRALGCNVRFTGHVSKDVGRNKTIDSHSGRGGSAMGDNARFVFSYVQHDPKEEKTWTAVPATAEPAAARGDLYRLHMTKQSYAKC